MNLVWTTWERWRSAYPQTRVLSEREELASDRVQTTEHFVDVYDPDLDTGYRSIGDWRWGSEPPTSSSS